MKMAKHDPGRMIQAGPSPAETAMVRQELWEEIRRVAALESVSISALSRRFNLDRKTIRRCLREPAYRGYQRQRPATTLLAEHEAFLCERAPEVEYSAQILYQELRAGHGYRGSYETVKRFVKPLRAVREQAQRALLRFETPPGGQSQIDWGESRVRFRRGVAVEHFFVMTLGFSRRAFYLAYPRESLRQFLDAHEQAFAYFAGHTREHLYDRPRTVCHPGSDGRVRWNATFKSFADYWGFEPRLCRAYRAQTKGKVESGVRYLKHNFLPGRRFVDEVDLNEQLQHWATEIADQRIHGTTHEPPIVRFQREAPYLLPTAGQPSFWLGMRASRVVAEDYLVSYQTNRYSVPFRLIGQRVEVERQGEQLVFYHRGEPVAVHTALEGTHQMRIDPAHGPGAIARNQRRTRTTPGSGTQPTDPALEVEIRDLAVYDHLAAAGGRESHP
ncbi:IS21 family transposase [Ectothiorhodospiraceae bacterium WFHF3C12]|nr:IS21 family transposase [Ectothiorhodospiraceae bacterium WFHF3C12]MBA1147919.1 IS21 family transposase [Ectothiorhodospiraceae bacterium WFHF3C12]MBA1149469.1 IS21 family transposase [Ectothiorhodospiraceae bacterium WFHF3C12]MBA1149494.1 IS21 family transposase [Ectothiorhodospiraceae bacterium WFHF3C12]